MSSMSDGGEALWVAGCGLRYWNHGDGTTVVLTHGAGTDHTIFDAQVRFLTEAGHRVITWDLRGHGRSVPWDEPFDPAQAVEDLASLLERLSIVRTVLVGHGLGANISQVLARRYPERVRALVIIGSSSNAARVTLRERLGDLVRTALLRRTPARALPGRLADLSATTPGARDFASRAFARMSKERLLELWAAPRQLHHRRRWYRSRVPLCLVRGEHDRSGVASSMRRWAPRELIREVVIPGAGHLVTLDAPKAVNGVLGTFLQELQPAVRTL
ncbi:alpha/beta fold hydrolase [Georgenia yuyongxinii]|nr:alpha/beta hydrolase [Georgenia yuyongxinii]